MAVLSLEVCIEVAVGYHCFNVQEHVVFVVLVVAPQWVSSVLETSQHVTGSLTPVGIFVKKCNILVFSQVLVVVVAAVPSHSPILRAICLLKALIMCGSDVDPRCMNPASCSE